MVSPFVWQRAYALDQLLYLLSAVTARERATSNATKYLVFCGKTAGVKRVVTSLNPAAV
jgi:hypothetical protein